MRRAWLVRTAAASTILVPIPLIAEAAVGWPVDPAVALFSMIVIAFAVVGWLVSERQPGNVVGPLMLAVGLPWALSMPADVYPRVAGSPIGADVVGIFVCSLDAPIFAVLALSLIRFPDGHLPSPRWRWTSLLTIATFVASFVGNAFQDAPLILYPQYHSPFVIKGFPAGFANLAYVSMFILLIGAAVSLVVRWRRGGTVERNQIKWIAGAAVITLLMEIANVATFDPANPNTIISMGAAGSIALVPVAMGVAILRYRLYAIDRIVSRTIAYAAVVAILSAAYVGIILALQALLAPITGGQTIAVAASTLAVFALFQPLLRRVRGAVDRRFDRARYDADLTVRTFAGRLRDDIDLGAVSAEIVRTAASAVRPATVAVWIRGTSRKPGGVA
jgi:hypothetical protein